ncbi:glutaredoxin [Caenimonas sedimenti]|uniref:Glutaredoxin n=1 Tax=Caenimonas sedimenti TaxID=2596921 RepID=A0A562ZM37_9BURK|nr:glutaredoxin [Caenimonas sedimenti]TWO69477.1 glutaredoxin [Caenimonas sedimenti]
MPRPILDETRIHPAARSLVAGFHQSIVREVMDAVAANDVGVVGMRQNPNPRFARKALDDIGQAYKYLEYGSYFNTWRRRLALKMWTGWPTFPMVFVQGTLVGGAAELKALIASGEFRTLVSGARNPPA